MLTHVERNEAMEILRRQPVRRAVETVPLDQALGRILAEDCRARLAVPSFDKSPFDGYACRAADLPGSLQVIGTAAAGCTALPEIHRGQALRIFTGAPLPAGADAVIRQEDAAADGSTVVIGLSPAPGTNIVRAGEDVRAGTPLLGAGLRLEPGHLGLLASQGIPAVPVFCRPRAILLPTGTELAEPGEPLGPYGIYNSSSYVLAAYLDKMGFLTDRRPILPDDPAAIRACVQAALESDAAIVLTTGGASVGDYDFADATARALQAERLFWKVNMKPGGALLVSRWREKLLINLSGNPAAALMSLLTVLRPFLERLTGSRDQAEELELPVREPMPKTSSVERMLRGHLHIAQGQAWFVEHQGRGNGNIASFAGCELIGAVPGGSGPLEKGDRIRAIRLPAHLL